MWEAGHATVPKNLHQRSWRQMWPVLVQMWPLLVQMWPVLVQMWPVGAFLQRLALTREADDRRGLALVEIQRKPQSLRICPHPPPRASSDACLRRTARCTRRTPHRMHGAGPHGAMPWLYVATDRQGVPAATGPPAQATESGRSSRGRTRGSLGRSQACTCGAWAVRAGIRRHGTIIRRAAWNIQHTPMRADEADLVDPRLRATYETRHTAMLMGWSERESGGHGKGWRWVRCVGG